MTKNKQVQKLDMTGIDMADEALWVASKDHAERLGMSHSWTYIFDLYYSLGGKQRLLYTVFQDRPCRFLCTISGTTVLLFFTDDRTLAEVGNHDIAIAPKQFKTRPKDAPKITVDIPAHCVSSSDGTALFLRTLTDYKITL